MAAKALTEDMLARLFARLGDGEPFAFFETTRISASERATLLFSRPVGRLLCRATDSPDDFFAVAQSYLDQGYHLAGWLAYEFGYRLEPVLSPLLPASSGIVLADFGVYPPPAVHDHATGVFSGPWPALPEQERDSAPAAGFTIEEVRTSEEQGIYEEHIRRIREYIARGDTYQVNYTLKILFELAGSPEALYLALRRNQSVGFGAMIRNGESRVLSFSPELFFRKTDRRIEVRPMKGTVRRGRTLAEDAGLADFLRRDVKNRSENVMIVDLLRNDLGRICRPGSVRTESLFDIETYETLHQMTSAIAGELPGGVSLRALFAALFPCGSVTGAPKIRTMEIIRELEGGWRGVYTGAVGYLSPDGGAVFNVPIRTVVLDGNRGEMGIGSGVVYDSEPAAEWEECLLKGRFLLAPDPAFALVETLVWQPSSGYWLLDYHLDRLCASARFFGFGCERAEIAARLLEYAVGFGSDQARRVRLLLAKEGGVSLESAAVAPPATDLAPLVEPATDLPVVVIATEPVDAAWPELYHKTTRRRFYDQQRELAVARGFYEALFVNTEGEVTEGAITNIFIRRGEEFLTPPVSSGLLAGVFRRHLLENCPLAVREAIIRPADLRAADAIYVGNSVRGLVQVRLAD